jgi:hypothetical protein
VGEVEVFGLTEHPKAKPACGWYHRKGKDDRGERFVGVLEILPVVSSITTACDSIRAGTKARKNERRGFPIKALSILVVEQGAFPNNAQRLISSQVFG